MLKVDQPGLIVFRAFQQHTTGPIAKEHTGRTVFKSSIVLILSAPMTITRRWAPLSMNWAPVVTAKTKPEQAACS